MLKVGGAACVWLNVPCIFVINNNINAIDGRQHM
jgi:hypothetical protein